MIELKNATILMGKKKLSDVSFTVPTGQYAVLMGRTGEGKSSILESICGLRTIERGAILLNGIDVTRWSPSDRAIGYVPQDLALFSNLNVREHLEFALRLRRHSQTIIRDKTLALAEWLGLSPLLERRVHRLSGGESQRVALGRALSFEPKVLLLDEPWSALDEETRRDMQSLMGKIREKTGVTTLHVTHNLEEAVALADSLLRLVEGKIEEVRKDSKIERDRANTKREPLPSDHNRVS